MVAVQSCHTYPILATDVPHTLYHRNCTLFHFSDLYSHFATTLPRNGDLLASIRCSANRRRCVKAIGNSRYLMRCNVQALGALFPQFGFTAQLQKAIESDESELRSTREELRLPWKVYNLKLSRTPRPHVAGYA